MNFSDIQIKGSSSLHQIVEFRVDSDKYLYCTYQQGYRGIAMDGESYEPITHTRVYRNKSWDSCYNNKQFMPVDSSNPEQTLVKIFKLMMLQ